MRVVLRPPVAHHPAGHTECQTLPFLVPLPPACIPSVALLATRAIRRICVKGKSGLGLFPLFPCLPCPFFRLSERTHSQQPFPQQNKNYGQLM